MARSGGDGEMIVGDLIRGNFPKTNAGMFYEDMDQLIVSLEKLSSFSPETVYMSHSGTISGDELKQTVKILKEKHAGNL